MVQKVEVITSIARRRRYTDEEKAHIVGETLEQGATVAGVARRHGLSQSLLFAWRKAMRIDQAPSHECLSVPGNAADIVRQIEAEIAVCRQALPPGRKRIRATTRLRELVTTALGSGLSPAKVAKLTGLPRTTVKSWRKKGMADTSALLPAPRELVLVEAPAPPVSSPVAVSSPLAINANARVSVGTSVTIELPVEALTEAMLRALVAAGGGK
jgi:transposase